MNRAASILIGMLLGIWLYSPAQTGNAPGFKASCLNMTFQNANSQVYLELSGQNFSHKDGLANLEIRISARPTGKSRSVVRKIYAENLYFGPNLELPKVTLTYPLKLSPGTYTLGIEVQDLATNRTSFQEVKYACTDLEKDYTWSDIWLLRNSALIPQEAVSTVIGEVLPTETSRIRFIAEAYATGEHALTGNAVLFRRKNNSGGGRTHRFISVAQVSKALSLEEGRAQFSHQFDLDTLPSGEYLLEVYLYENGILKGSQSRRFVRLWKGMDNLLEDLEASIQQMRYVTSAQNITDWLAAKPTERRSAFKQFWFARNPSDSQAPTDAMEAYFGKIAFANKAFRESLPGWETDRGQTYFNYGQPDDKQLLEHKGRQFELWLFKQWGLKFVFVQKGNNFVRVDPGKRSQL